jgi:hypothetical protein
MKKLNFLQAKIPFSVYIIVFVLILLAGVLNLIFNKPDSYMENKDSAIKECIKECNKAIAVGTILTDGPCLSEEIVKGWACDIANKPKIDIIDNNPNNQCKLVNKKNIPHLVTVTQNCSLISAK